MTFQNNNRLCTCIVVVHLNIPFGHHKVIKAHVNGPATSNLGRILVKSPNTAGSLMTSFT